MLSNTFLSSASTVEISVHFSLVFNGYRGRLLKEQVYLLKVRPICNENSIHQDAFIL